MKSQSQKFVESTTKVANALADIANGLEELEKMHSKDGVGYTTTKKLLGFYRRLKYDIIAEKTMQTVEIMEDYDLISGSDNSIEMNLDYLLSLPENFTYCSNEIKKFMSSSEPARCGQFIHMVESGMELLKKEDEHLYDVLYHTYIEGSRQPDIEEIVKATGLPRAGYYRHKEKAITALSIILFGPLCQRHPAVYSKSSPFFSKYEKVFRFVDDLVDCKNAGKTAN